ncbi:hypothetical protein PRIPAC_87097, partial [Pristionchus pacificus]
ALAYMFNAGSMREIACPVDSRTGVESFPVLLRQLKRVSDSAARPSSLPSPARLVLASLPVSCATAVSWFPSGSWPHRGLGPIQGRIPSSPSPY